MSVPRRVEVTWLDSSVADRWVAPADLVGRRASTCVSVGYLVDEGPDAVTIAQSVGLGEDGVEEYGQPLTIPRVALVGEPRVVVLNGTAGIIQEARACSSD